ncbi:MAG TPA: hypothetical protein VFO16_24265 [Pseudonocardiaceae bacterium]|nr:hypothetical protein [Pseudonocardiaceae bacterium]
MPTEPQRLTTIALTGVNADASATFGPETAGNASRRQVQVDGRAAAALS